MKRIFFLALAVGTAFPGICSGQSIGFQISKQAQYQQLSDAGAVLDGYSAAWSISADTDDAFSDPCQVSFPGPISPLALGNQGNYLPAGNVWYRATPYYPDLASLDADVPAGDHIFEYSANALPAGMHTVPLPPSLFCDEVPEFTGDTWSRLQAIENDLSSDFVGTISGFSEVPGANYSNITVYIFDYSHGAIYFSAYLPSSATTFTIPADSLQPGYAYYTTLNYSTGVLDEAGGVAGGASDVGFTRSANAYFNTRGPCPADLNGDGLVDDEDFVIFAAAYNILYCGEAVMPEKCPADLTNDGYVLDDDFVSFVPAYNDLLCP